MKVTSRSPDSFIDSLPETVQQDIRALDDEIQSLFTGARRVLWEGTFWGGSKQTIIGYGDLVQKRPRGPDVQWFMVGLAVQKNYISLYVNAIEDRQYLAEKYADQLGTVKIGKSSISFKHLSDLNVPVLRKVLKKAFKQLGAG